MELKATSFTQKHAEWYDQLCQRLKRPQLIYPKRFASDLSIFYYHSSQWTFSGVSVCVCLCVTDHLKEVLSDSRIKSYFNFSFNFPPRGAISINLHYKNYWVSSDPNE